MKKRILSLLLVLVMLAGMIPAGVTTAAIVITPSSADEVPLRDKITQMMMVDFRYWDENLEDSISRTGFTVMNDQVRKIVEDNNFGAVILFSNNIQDTE